MFLRTQNQLKWGKHEWISFAKIFCFLILFPLMNGYPFVGSDAWRYASGEIAGMTNIGSPVLACVMRPAVVLGGPWGYVVVQLAVTAFTLVFLSDIVLKRYYKIPLYISILVTGVGLFAGLLMADVWTLIGLICLFSISIGHGYPIIAVLLAVSYSVHYGNFPVFIAAALFFLPFVQSKVKYITIIFFCILGGIVLLITANLLGGEIRIGPKVGKFVSPASRILHDIPEVIDKKCQDDPEFKLCEIKEEIHKWSRGRGAPQSVMWKGSELLKIDVASKQFNDLMREVFFYSLKNFFTQNLSALVRNTYKSLRIYRISYAFQTFRLDSHHIQRLKEYFPDDLDDYEKSWQARSRLRWGLKNLEMPLTALFWLSIILCLAYIGLFWKTRHEDVIVKLSIFAVIAVLVNAFLMSNLGGQVGRYYARIGFLPIFPAFIIISKLTDRLKKIIVYPNKGKS